MQLFLMQTLRSEMQISKRESCFGNEEYFEAVKLHPNSIGTIFPYILIIIEIEFMFRIKFFFHLRELRLG